MENNYFFVDGSALLTDVKRLRQEEASLAGRRLDLVAFSSQFTGHNLQQFHGGYHRRFTFYFVEGDDRLERELILPDVTVPGVVEDLRIDRCGRSIREFRRAQEWLAEHNAPEYVSECLYRSEKAVDTQICADALQLAAVNKLDRLFLYTNDYDFVPLCRTLRHLGLNVNLFRLRAFSVNKALAQECDALHEMRSFAIQSCFLPSPPVVSADAALPPLPNGRPAGELAPAD